jgi:hypothetical protein
MAQNQEQIEARLCEYVEGTLTDDQRAEIEKHLASNPQHRKLIGELLKTRDLVRQLPRATAPPDVSETLQGQLERSVLLGTMPDELEGSRLRIGFWSRMRAIAAVLLLAAGLGAAGFYVLRNARSPLELATLPPKHETTEATTLPTAAGSAIAGAPELESSASLPAEMGDAARRREATEIASATPPSTPAPALTSNAFSNSTPAGSGAGGGRAAAEDAMFGPALAEKLKASSGSNEFQCFVASVPDKEVTRYLDDNRISWTNEPMPEPLAPVVNQSVMSSRMAQNSMRLGSRAIEPLPRDRMDNTQPMFGAQTQPTTQPAQEPLDKQAATALADRGAKDELDLQKTLPKEPAAAEVAQQQRLIRVANLTRQQAADLRANLTNGGKAGETLDRVINEQPVGGKPAAVPTDGDLAAGLAKKLPTTEPVEIPSTQPSVATPQALSGGELTLATTAPTTEPAEQRVDVVIVVDNASAPPTTAPSTQPATQPAAPAETSPEEK